MLGCGGEVNVKLTILFLTMLMTSMTIGAQPNDQELVQRLCEGSSPQNKLVSNWKESDDGFCAEVFCRDGEREIQRKKCFSHKSKEEPNTVWETYSDTVKAPDSYGYHGYANDRRLYPGESCYDECAPVKKKILGIRVKDEFGLNRESCRSCFANLKTNKRDSDYFIPEVNMTMYSGMKCYSLCRLPKGEFKNSRDYSPECQSCVGMNGLMPEKFDYLVNQENSCWEVEKMEKIRAVPHHICQGKENLITTRYSSGSAYTFKTIFMKKEPECHEIDDVTAGKLYDRLVDPSHCRTENIVDTDRSIQSKDNAGSGKRNSNRSSGASKE